MYYNVFGEKVSRARYKEMLVAAENRRELIAAGLTSRRDLFKMGLLTAGGMLVAKAGLRSRAYGQTTNGGSNPKWFPNKSPAHPVTTHLHNGHTASESDGNPCDFYGIGNFCDQYYPNVLAGFNFDFKPNGDINESLSTLWYHDHRVDFTAQNTYKGLLGFYCLFNQFDTGDETTGFRLPSFPQFDIPLAFADKVYDPKTGLLAFDLFNLDGILLPVPVQVQSVRIGVAERVDIIIDFSQFAGKTIYLENRLNQLNGQGPVDDFGTNGTSLECSGVLGTTVPSILPAGQGNLLLQFNVAGGTAVDNSLPPSPQEFYHLPRTDLTPRVIRTFKFNRL